MAHQFDRGLLTGLIRDDDERQIGFLSAHGPQRLQHIERGHPGGAQRQIPTALRRRLAQRLRAVDTADGHGEFALPQLALDQVGIAAIVLQQQHPQQPVGRAHSITGKYRRRWTSPDGRRIRRTAVDATAMRIFDDDSALMLTGPLASGGSGIPRTADDCARSAVAAVSGDALRPSDDCMIDAPTALQRLREGNCRFIAGASRTTLGNRLHRGELAGGQAPFAIILGCSDSRVPAEIVFDQGLGDLFVIRVAGNIVASSQVGSAEFAAERFGTRLIVVLGHSRCGAVSATVEELRRPRENQSPNLRSIVDRVRPSVEALLETELRHDHDALVHHAVRSNVRASANHLRHGSAVLEGLIEREGLRVVGAEYSLETGMVEFFDGAS